MFSDHSRIIFFHSRIKLQINNKRKFRKFTNISKLITYLNNQLVKEKGIENKIRKYVEIIKTKALNTETRGPIEAVLREIYSCEHLWLKNKDIKLRRRGWDVPREQH